VILTVTVNTALDVTYLLDRITPGEAHRVPKVLARAGGKGVNVGRVLSALGAPTTVCGFAGGATGSEVAAELADAGMTSVLVPTSGPTRRTVTAVDRSAGTSTAFYEPGPEIDDAEWRQLDAAVLELLKDASMLVLAGSLPEGAPAATWERMCRMGREAGVPTVLDSSGPALVAALDEHLLAVKPNEHELVDLAGHISAAGDPPAGPPLDVPTALALTRRLQARTTGLAVTTLGARGLLAVLPDGQALLARPPQVAGNPVGAGDAVTAGIALGLTGSEGPTTWLPRAAALGSAAVLADQAGDVALDHLDELSARTTLELL